jgi:hypothetical protein
MMLMLMAMITMILLTATMIPTMITDYAVSVGGQAQASRASTVASLCQISSDAISVPTLTVNGLRIISQVLAQVGSLDSTSLSLTIAPTPDGCPRALREQGSVVSAASPGLS